MKKMIGLLSIFTCLTLLNASDASACSCAPPPTALSALQRSNAVFTGKISQINYLDPITYGEPRVEVTFDVKTSWKGRKSATIMLDTVINAMSCEGYFFKEGEEYLVYAYRKPNGKLGVRLCSRTRELRNAQGDLKELGQGIRQQENTDSVTPVCS